MKELYSSAEPWGHGCGQILSPALHLHISLRHRHGACPAVLKNQYKFLFQINSQYPYIHLCHLSLLKSEYHTNFPSSFSSYDSRQTQQIILNFQWFEWQRDFIVPRDHNVLVFVLFCFFHNSHNMRQTDSVTSYCCVKRKTKHKAVKYFSQYDYHVPRRVKRLSQGYMDWEDVGKSSKAEERKEDYESPYKGPGLSEGERKILRFQAEENLLCWEQIST